MYIIIVDANRFDILEAKVLDMKVFKTLESVHDNGYICLDRVVGSYVSGRKLAGVRLPWWSARFSFKSGGRVYKPAIDYRNHPFRLITELVAVAKRTARPTFEKD